MDAREVMMKTVDELYANWELDTGDKSDIQSALEEMFFVGALYGGKCKDVYSEALAVFPEALAVFHKREKDGEITNKPITPTGITAIDDLA